MAPSGRELSLKATEGERVQLDRIAVNARKRELSRAPFVFCYAKSTSLPEGGILKFLIIKEEKQ